jgi:hypothetical protein
LHQSIRRPAPLHRERRNRHDFQPVYCAKGDFAVTEPNDVRDRSRFGGEQVDVALGVPTDRVRWGPILAGTFAALTGLAVLSTLGAAIGLSAYDRGDSPGWYAMGAGIWGVIAMILAFLFGGWITGRSTAIRGGENGLLNGFMVGAVALPLLMFLLGSASTMVGTRMMDAGGDTAVTSPLDQARQASATITSPDQTALTDQSADARRLGSGAAWTVLASMVLALTAASIAGYAGARDEHGDTARPGDAGRFGTTTP